MQEFNLKLDKTQWNEITITIKPKGKPPAKFGEGVYRFSEALTLCPILPRLGWELIKKRADGAYFRPPESNPVPPFKIVVAIPTEQEAISIAKQLFENGRSWAGAIGEWIGIYLHDRRAEVHEIVSLNPTETRAISSFPVSASLKIGESGVWMMDVSKTGNDWHVS